jgi:bacillopeptidase F
MERKIRTGVPSYTYRQFNKENKQIYRRLAIIIGLTVILLLVIWFWGISFIQIMGGLNSKGSSDNNTSLDIPLEKPTLSSLPEFTNKGTITVSGSTTVGADVALYLNGAENGKTVADKSGTFSFTDVSLKEGLNFIKVVASNKAEQTQEERTTITMDQTAPILDITQPTNNQVFEKDTKTVTIKGTTEADSSVYINSIQTPIYQGSSFSYMFSLTAGENKIEIKATDQAGNTKTINLTLIVKS